MQKLMFKVMVGAAALAPLAAKADVDHVNLWPLVYEDGAGVDFIWPLGRYEGPGQWRFFPIVKDGGDFFIVPAFHLDSQGFMLFPLSARYDLVKGNIFPLVWWDKREGFAVLPFAAKNDLKKGMLFPFLWWNVDKSFSTLFPLYYYDADRHGDATFWAAAGLGGWHKDKLGRVDANWLLPLWAKADDTFVSIPFSYEKDADGNIRDWFSLPLLSGGSREKGKESVFFLGGLAGHGVDRGITKSWLAPAFYHDSMGVTMTPLFYRDPETLVTPVYGRTRSASWGLPGWYRDETTFVSPLWYSEKNDATGFARWCVPPLLSGGSVRNGDRSTKWLLGLAGSREMKNGFASSWCAPLYYRDNEGRFITPLYGQTAHSSWLAPIWYEDDTTLISPLWCHARDADGSLKRWTIPALLSGGGVARDGTHEFNALLGLGGATWGGPTGETSNWLLPFYYDGGEGSFATPLAGKWGAKSWVLPLYWRNGETGDFLSLPYIRDRRGGSTTHIVPPLLTQHTAFADGASQTSIAFAYNHKTDKTGKTELDALFPLYRYDGRNDEFLSLPFGSVKKDGHRRTWWATPLVGTYSEGKTGGWLFPLVNRKKDESFDRDYAVFKSDRLAADVDIARSFHSRVTGSVLVGSDQDRTVSGHREGRDYHVCENVKRGNKLIFRREGNHAVTFDGATRERKNESANGKTWLLGGLFHRTHSYNRKAGTSATHTRILWKFWDRAEEDGRVTLDAFPFISHASDAQAKTSTTSFMGRMFRYEKDPKKGIALDLAFLPILRP